VSLNNRTIELKTSLLSKKQRSTSDDKKRALVPVRERKERSPSEDVWRKLALFHLSKGWSEGTWACTRTLCKMLVNEIWVGL